MRGRSRRKKRTGKMVSLQKRFLAFMLVSRGAQNVTELRAKRN